jgi:glycosyltransferase involved in cell wall biosynthesis
MSFTSYPRVAIDAALKPRSGGVRQAVITLVRSLGTLDDGGELYTIVVSNREQFDWLEPFIGVNQRLVMKPQSEVRDGNAIKRSLRPLVRYLRRVLGNNSKQWPEVPVSDGFFEKLGCDVVHMPTQDFFLCALPTVYNPHDLQHLHYPQFFSASAIAWRETIYPAGCHFAHTVVVGSRWIKDDVVRNYRIDPSKVQIVPEGAPTEFSSEPSPDCLTSVKTKYQLEQPFAFYPAVTWPHKNHILLLEALAHLRDRHGERIRLVCTGSHSDGFWPVIQRRIEELRLSSQVAFLGVVPDSDLRAMYRLAEFLVQPTLFEASSLPIFEAWLEGTPVACSDVTALPDQVMDAALLFDPNDVGSIANAISKLARDPELRQELRTCGYRRLKDFDSERRTARAYRAIYRRAARFHLTEEDRWLLSWDWMRNPIREMEVLPQ